MYLLMDVNKVLEWSIDWENKDLELVGWENELLWLVFVKLRYGIICGVVWKSFCFDLECGWSCLFGDRLDFVILLGCRSGVEFVE